MFDGLFPEPSQQIVIDLLYTLAHWHALAKLQLHMDTTLHELSVATQALGQELRRFCNIVCLQFKTLGTNFECNHCLCRTDNSQPSSSDPPQAKMFNLSTYKIHALGDYVEHI